MKNNKHIMLDLDQCIANTSRALLKEVHQKYGIGPGDEPYLGSRFRFEEVFPNLSESYLIRIFNSPSFWDRVKPFYGAYNFTKELCEMATVSIVTGRTWYKNISRETTQWLKYYNISYDNLYFIENEGKASFCAENSIDVAIEDHPDNISSISRVCPVVVIRWPYNDVSLLRSNKDDNKTEEVATIIPVNSYSGAILEIQQLFGIPYSERSLYPQSTLPISQQ